MEGPIGRDMAQWISMDHMVVLDHIHMLSRSIRRAHFVCLPMRAGVCAGGGWGAHSGCGITHQGTASTGAWKLRASLCACCELACVRAVGLLVCCGLACPYAMTSLCLCCDISVSIQRWLPCCTACINNSHAKNGHACMQVRVVGCQPAVSDVMRASVAAGHIVHAPPHATTLSDATAGGIEEGAITLEPCMRWDAAALEPYSQSLQC